MEKGGSEEESDQKKLASPTSILDVDIDPLVECTSDLTKEDICNMAMSCKHLQTVAYSDPVWLRLSRDRWPENVLSSFPQSSSVREAYLARHTAVQQLKFDDPEFAVYNTISRPFNFLHLSKDEVTFSQGSEIYMIKINRFHNRDVFLTTLNGHRATVTSMRLFPVTETNLFRSESQKDENVMLTSSNDHSIRLWWKGSCHRCFKGHNGPVSTLSDTLLGDGSGKIFASGGEDGTVRLWSLSSSGNRGQNALKATLYGHEKPISLLSVAGHKTSLLVSISKNYKVRVWDTTVSSTVRSSFCVGTTAVPGPPVGMKCYESLVYVCAGFSVVAFDLRTMQKVYTSSNYQSELLSFEIMPSKSLICTGGMNRAMLWDIRRNQTEPLAELDGHTGAIKSLHMDTYKIVTAGPDDTEINVWDPNTGDRINTLTCNPPCESTRGCSAIAVSGSRIVTGSHSDEGHIILQDFANAMCPPVSSREDKPGSKFWGPQSSSDSDEDSFMRLNRNVVIR